MSDRDRPDAHAVNVHGERAAQESFDGLGSAEGGVEIGDGLSSSDRLTREKHTEAAQGSDKSPTGQVEPAERH